MARATIHVNLKKCIGCKKCMDACFTDVFRFDEARNKIIAKYPDECEWCLICETQCPNDCIKVIPIKPVYVPYPFD